MLITRRQTIVWSISSWALLIISCVIGVSEARLAIGPSSLNTDTIRSLVQRHPGSPLVTNWLANIINQRLTDTDGKTHHIVIRKSEGDYHKIKNENKDESLRAVCTLQSSDPSSIDVSGIIELTQAGPDKPVLISSVITASTEQDVSGNHGFHIHTSAVPSSGDCKGTGGHYNPFEKDHGAPDVDERHVGDLGNIVMSKGEDGIYKSAVDITDSLVTLFGDNSVIDRGIVLHAGEDDLGLGGEDDSLTTGHAGSRIACCTINVLQPEGVISFSSIRGFVDDNVTMVELDVMGEGTFLVTNLTFTYNGVEQHQELPSSWTGGSQVFNFEADVFEAENIELSLIGRNGALETARGTATFEFRDPGVEMSFVGSDTKTSVRIASEVLESGVSGSVVCNPSNNETACYALEKVLSYCKIVTTTQGDNITVCDSSQYIHPLNEFDGGVDLMWMEMPMEMDGMTMDMPMLMATAKFSQMPAKMEVVIYADDDPSKIYSPPDYFCEIQDMDKMDMDGTMCHQMLPDEIPGDQEGVQVLVVGLDENGDVIASGVQHAIVNEDFTAIIVGSCLAAVVGMACIVALVGCYVEKRKK